MSRVARWWSQSGSNRRPPACKAGALPAELWPRCSGHSLDAGHLCGRLDRQLSCLFVSKGGDPAAPSDTATLLRLHPNHLSHLRRLAPYGYSTDFGCYKLSWCDGRCVHGPGTYSPRHADPRLLAIPTSWSRVADSNPDYDALSGIGSPSRVGNPLYAPLYDVCSPTHKGHEDLTSSPPSSGLSPAVPLECSTECSN